MKYRSLLLHTCRCIVLKCLNSNLGLNSIVWVFSKLETLFLLTIYPLPLSGPCLLWPSAGQVRSRPLHSSAQCAAAPAALQPVSAFSASAAQQAPSRRGPASARARAAAVVDARASRVIPLLPPPVEPASEPGSCPTRRPRPALAPRGPARRGPLAYLKADPRRLSSPNPSACCRRRQTLIRQRRRHSLLCERVEPGLRRLPSASSCLRASAAR
jgi:hypothetical protein